MAVGEYASLFMRGHCRGRYVGLGCIYRVDESERDGRCGVMLR